MKISLTKVLILFFCLSRTVFAVTYTGRLLDYLNSLKTYTVETIGTQSDVPKLTGINQVMVLEKVTLYGIVYTQLSGYAGGWNSSTVKIPLLQPGETSTLPLKVYRADFGYGGTGNTEYKNFTTKINNLVAGAGTYTINAPLINTLGDPYPGQTSFLHLYYTYDITKAPIISDTLYNKLLDFFDNRILDANYYNNLMPIFSKLASTSTYPPATLIETARKKNLSDRISVMTLELKLMSTFSGIVNGSIQISDFLDPNNATYASDRSDATTLRALKAALTR